MGSLQSRPRKLSKQLRENHTVMRSFSSALVPTRHGLAEDDLLKHAPSKWAHRQPPFKVMEVLKRARAIEREGRRVIHFEVGEPEFPTPLAVVKAGKQALDDGHTGYSEALGIPELRIAIADDYRSRFGINVDPSRVAVTSGASGALNLLFSVLLNPGDRVLMPDPGYPCNEAFVRLVGGEPMRLVHKINCFHNKSITFPPAYRVPIKSGQGFGMMVGIYADNSSPMHPFNV